MEMKSKELLKIKVTLLRSRTWMVAAKSAAVGTVPIPGVTAVYDVAVIEAEVRHQRKQLGIDDKNLKFIAENLGVEVDELKERIRVKIGANADMMELLSGKTLDSFLVRLMGQPLTASCAEALNTATLTLPIIGSFVAGGISFAATYASLTYMLNQYEKMAAACLDVVFSEDDDDDDE